MSSRISSTLGKEHTEADSRIHIGIQTSVPAAVYRFSIAERPQLLVHICRAAVCV